MLIRACADASQIYETVETSDRKRIEEVTVIVQYKG